MALDPGTRFGPYAIAGPIGAGGMGEVYRAKDTVLERDVAIKVLPESFAADADRVARFEREAKTLASLNHTNIAQVFGLEKGAGATAIIMELVEGPTLAERIAQGPLPPSEALDVAMQVANALEAAHAQGITHRDLKPANVKLKSDGTIKVLDFGIAKVAVAESGASGPTPTLVTPAATQTGIILGTAAYMSPEQARGKPVDQRADIWAYGCLLVEMLTGQPAFGGEDVMLTLARVLDRDTDLSSMPGTVSGAVRRTIELCLRKNPTKRIADIRDVKLALAGEFETVAPGTDGGHAPAAPFWKRPLAVAAAALVLGIALASIAAMSFRPEPVPRALKRFSYLLAEGNQFRRQGENVLAVSPDGRHFVINTVSGLFLRPMDTLEGRLIPGTAEDIAAPFFSPDGQSIGYWAASGSVLKRIGVAGGAPVVIASIEPTGAPRGVYWAPNDTIYFAEARGISRVAANGGTPELLFATGDAERFNGIELLPDGDTLIFSIAGGASWDRATIVAQSMSTGERTMLIEGGSSARYVPTGHIVYALGDGLFAMAFDAERVRVSGRVVPVVQAVSRALLAVSGVANYGLSDDGTLIYLSAAGAGIGMGASFALSWVDRDGREEPLGLEPCTCIGPVLSPDGTRIAFMRLDDAAADADIWIWSIAQRSFTRLTFEPGLEGAYAWSPDSTRIAYSSSSGGVFVRRADGTGVVDRLLDGLGAPTSWSESGEILYLMPNEDGPGTDIGALSVESVAGPRRLLATPFDEQHFDLSPDGRWLAYDSDESGRSEVYVRPYPDVDAGRWQVSTTGGRTPQWSADSSMLYFVGPEAVMTANVTADPSFAFDSPRPRLARAAYTLMAQAQRDYVVSLDGERLLMYDGSGAIGGRAGEFVIVENWTDELERLVPQE